MITTLWKMHGEYRRAARDGKYLWVWQIDGVTLAGLLVERMGLYPEGEVEVEVWTPNDRMLAIRGDQDAPVAYEVHGGT
jgi:hypothetical protein